MSSRRISTGSSTRPRTSVGTSATCADTSVDLDSIIQTFSTRVGIITAGLCHCIDDLFLRELTLSCQGELYAWMKDSAQKIKCGIEPQAAFPVEEKAADLTELAMFSLTTRLSARSVVMLNGGKAELERRVVSACEAMMSSVVELMNDLTIEPYGADRLISLMEAGINETTEDYYEICDAKTTHFGALSEHEEASQHDLSSIVRTTLQLMTANPEATMMPTIFCRQLRDIVEQSSAHKELLIDLDVVPKLLDIMGVYVGNGAMQREGLLTLCALAPYDGQLKQAFVSLGGISAILPGMTLHREDATLQCSACRFLAEVTSLYEFDEAGLLDSVCLQGVIQGIVKALETHVGNEEVRKSGLKVLAALVCDCSQRGMQIEDVLSLVAEYKQDVMSTVVGAMRERLQDLAMQERGCLALTYMGDISACGVQAILYALAEHLGQSSLQRHGFEALCFMAQLRPKIDEAPTWTSVASHDGINVVRKGMEAHIGCADIQRLGCTVLTALIAAGQAKTATLESIQAVAQAVLKSMQKHSSDMGVQKVGCNLIAEISFSITYGGRLFAVFDGISVVLAALQTDPSDASLQTAAIYALCAIANSDRNKRTILERGGRRLVSKAMKNHKDEELTSVSIGMLAVFDAMEVDSAVGRRSRGFQCLGSFAR